MWRCGCQDIFKAELKECTKGEQSRVAPGLWAGSTGRMKLNSKVGGEDGADLVLRQRVGVREIQDLGFWPDFSLLEWQISFETMVNKVIH